MPTFRVFWQIAHLDKGHYNTIQYDLAEKMFCVFTFFYKKFKVTHNHPPKIYNALNRQAQIARGYFLFQIHA